MKKTVLVVGNCSSDHAAIAGVLRDHFSIEVVRAAGADDAIQFLTAQRFALVLVNRVFAADGGDGIALIRRIKADPALASTPVMLVSDLPHYQGVAVEAGAESGFGKSELASPATHRKLHCFLG